MRTRPADGNSRRCAATGAPLDHPPGDDESADELRRQRSVHRRIRLAGGSPAGSATATGRPDEYPADAARPAGGRRVVRLQRRQRRVHPWSVAESRGGPGRSARPTHFDPDQPEKMAVNLSSGPGVRGQELGALLGYQFGRGLHDGHGDPSLNQHIPAFRATYRHSRLIEHVPSLQAGHDGPLLSLDGPRTSRHRSR